MRRVRTRDFMVFIVYGWLLASATEISSWSEALCWSGTCTQVLRGQDCKQPIICQPSKADPKAATSSSFSQSLLSMTSTGLSMFYFLRWGLHQRHLHRQLPWSSLHWDGLWWYWADWAEKIKVRDDDEYDGNDDNYNETNEANPLSITCL